LRKNIIIILLFLLVCNLFGQDLSTAKYFIYGDTRNGHEYHREIIQQMSKDNNDCGFILNTGDLVMLGFWQGQWDTFLDIIKPVNDSSKNHPVYLAAVGNHDIVLNSVSYSKWHENLPWLPGNGVFYKFDYKNIRLIVLNSCDEKTFSEQTDSLISWLSTNHARWLIVSWHHPSYSFGTHSSNLKSREDWWPILYKYKVNLVFNGHAHQYARTCPIKPISGYPFGIRDDENGVIQIITGGGGAPLSSVKKEKDNEDYFDNLLAASNDQEHHYCEITATDNELIVEAKDTKGNVFDKLVLKK
jgi:hypothetical protein